MASVKGTVGTGVKIAIGSLWMLVVLAIAFFILYLLQQKQPIGFIQKGATLLGNAAKGKEVGS